ncbi:MAG: type II secretion system protein GspE, partial [Gammaproteobacteria bacterium]
TVTGILAQRLVRRLCAECREPYEALPELVARLKEGGFEPPSGPLLLYREKGCAACGGTGFRGRIALLEFLVMSDAIRSLILQHAAAGAIQKVAKAEGMKTMLSDGYHKALAGTTTFSEVLRVAQEIR